jgi:peptidoglycan/LPS O-acetylase OafA/YrhL
VPLLRQKRVPSPVLVVLLVFLVVVLLWNASALPIYWSTLLIAGGAIAGLVVYVFEYNRNREIFIWKNELNVRDKVGIVVVLCLIFWPLVVYAISDRDFMTENGMFLLSSSVVLLILDLLRRQLGRRSDTRHD